MGIQRESNPYLLVHRQTCSGRYTTDTKNQQFDQDLNPELRVLGTWSLVIHFNRGSARGRLPGFDKPYDRFVLEQLAGDVLGADVTGFLVGGANDVVTSPDPVLTAQQRADVLHDMVSTPPAR